MSFNQPLWIPALSKNRHFLVHGLNLYRSWDRLNLKNSPEHHEFQRSHDGPMNFGEPKPLEGEQRDWWHLQPILPCLTPIFLLGTALRIGYGSTVTATLARKEPPQVVYTSTKKVMSPADKTELIQWD